MSKKFNEKLNNLKQTLTVAATAIGSNTQLTPQVYSDTHRREINKQLCELALGAEFKSKKDGKWSVNLKGKQPDGHQLAEVCELLQDYIVRFEEPLLAAFISNGMMDEYGNPIVQTPTPAVAAGMEIPPEQPVTPGVPAAAPVAAPQQPNMIAGPCNRRVAFIDKVNKKKLNEAVIGNGLNTGYMTMFLQPSDIVIMADNGRQLRKKSRKTMMLIAGGIVIAVAAGVAIAMYVHSKKKNKADAAAELTASLEEMTVDLESGGMMDGDDAPVVTL